MAKSGEEDDGNLTLGRDGDWRLERVWWALVKFSLILIKLLLHEIETIFYFTNVSMPSMTRSDL